MKLITLQDNTRKTAEIRYFQAKKQKKRYHLRYLELSKSQKTYELCLQSQKSG